MKHKRKAVRKTDPKPKRGRPKILDQHKVFAAEILSTKRKALDYVRATTKALRKDANVPREERLAKIRATTESVEQALSEIRTMFADKALGMLQQINPQQVHPNTRPLAAAILVDKALALQKSIQTIHEPTPQEKIMEFIRTNNVPFHQLQHIIQHNQIPEGMPPDLFRQLQQILRPTSPHKILDV